MGHQMGHYSAGMGHHSATMGHYFAMMGHQSAKMGHKGTPTDTILTSAGVMVKKRLGEELLRGFRALSGRKMRSGCRKRTWSHLAILAACGIILSTGFQPSKGGDMVCARGPLGACVAIYHKVGEGPLRSFGAVPFLCCRKTLKSLD
jgi:hypothetical protein